MTRSESVIQHIINAERYFWDCVEKDIPPSVDASESASKAIQQLYPTHVPLTVEDLSQNETANLMFDKLIKLKEEIQHKQERFDALKHQIQMMMKDAERATFSSGSVVWKKANDNVSLDTKALLKHQPDLIEQYPLKNRAVVDLISISIESYTNLKLKAQNAPLSTHVSRELVGRDFAIYFPNFILINFYIAKGDL